MKVKAMKNKKIRLSSSWAFACLAVIAIVGAHLAAHIYGNPQSGVGYWVITPLLAAAIYVILAYLARRQKFITLEGINDKADKKEE